MPSIDRPYPCILIRALAFTVVVATIGCSSPDVDIVSGSTHIKAILHELTQGQARSHNLIPPAACPGHCDMRPSDVEAVAECTALLIHPWQQAMANVSGVVESSGIGDDRIHVINVEGNWMAPPAQAAAVTAISEVLSEVEPANATSYQQRAGERAEAVIAFGSGLTEELEQSDATSVKVLCNQIQVGFVKWAGFDVVSTFGRPEDLSVADVEALIHSAQERGVTLVVDNLQSGETKMSEAVARDLGAVRVVLSNFPGGFEGTETWEKAVRRNVDLLLEAATEARQGHG